MDLRLVLVCLVIGVSLGHGSDLLEKLLDKRGGPLEDNIKTLDRERRDRKWYPEDPRPNEEHPMVTNNHPKIGYHHDDNHYPNHPDPRPNQNNNHPPINSHGNYHHDDPNHPPVKYHGDYDHDDPNRNRNHPPVHGDYDHDYHPDHDYQPDHPDHDYGYPGPKDVHPKIGQHKKGHYGYPGPKDVHPKGVQHHKNRYSGENEGRFHGYVEKMKEHVGKLGTIVSSRHQPNVPKTQKKGRWGPNRHKTQKEQGHGRPVKSRSRPLPTMYRSKHSITKRQYYPYHYPLPAVSHIHPVAAIHPVYHPIAAIHPVIHPAVYPVIHPLPIIPHPIVSVPHPIYHPIYHPIVPVAHIVPHPIYHQIAPVVVPHPIYHPIAPVLVPHPIYHPIVPVAHVIPHPIVSIPHIITHPIVPLPHVITHHVVHPVLPHMYSPISHIGVQHVIPHYVPHPVVPAYAYTGYHAYPGYHGYAGYHGVYNRGKRSSMPGRRTRRSVGNDENETPNGQKKWSALRELLDRPVRRVIRREKPSTLRQLIEKIVMRDRMGSVMDAGKREVLRVHRKRAPVRLRVYVLRLHKKRGLKRGEKRGVRRGLKRKLREQMRALLDGQ